MKVLILMYHRVANNATDKRYTLSLRRFARQMKHLHACGYSVVGLRKIVDAIHGKIDLPGNAMAITFDDGFKDTYEYAVPVLREFGYPATFFLVSQLMGKESYWTVPRGITTAPLMSWADASHLIGSGFSIGSHTSTHPDLTHLREESLESEINGSKQEIEDRLGLPIEFFAYPYGLFDIRSRNIVENCGFKAACSTQSGFNNLNTNLFSLRRIDVSGEDSIRTFSWSLTFGENSMTAKRVATYYARRVLPKFMRVS